MLIALKKFIGLRLIKNNFTKTVISLLLVFIGLIACDAYQKVTGTVIDQETGKPLSGATVFNKNKAWNKIQTDSLGNFELSEISSGMHRTPSMIIVIEKENYQKQEISVPLKEEKPIIKLEKAK